jgi:hypothetical protein
MLRAPAPARSAQQDRDPRSEGSSIEAKAEYAMAGSDEQDDGLDSSLLRSAEVVRTLDVGRGLRDHIADLERSLAGKDRDEATVLVANDRITSEVLLAALAIKAMAGQIEVAVHALGILVLLPHLLDDGKVIERLSLGAGNTVRSHDLETDRRVAEFKFITWRGGAEAIRQSSLFVDLFNLASRDTAKRRDLYVLGRREPLRFLNGNRAIRSVLSKHASVLARFDQRHAADGFVTVGQYWATVRDRVDLIDGTTETSHEYDNRRCPHRRGATGR